MSLAGFCLFFAVILLSYLILKKRSNYWRVRGVVHAKRARGREAGQAFRSDLREFYEACKHAAPFGGFYVFKRPVAILLDLDLIENVLTKDFNTFPDRRFQHSDKGQVLWSSISNLNGGKWRQYRDKMIPAFTSERMEILFPKMLKVCKNLAEMIAGNSTSSKGLKSILEMKEILNHHCSNIIAHCVYGLDVEKPKSGRETFHRMIQRALASRQHDKFGNSNKPSISSLWSLLGFPSVSRKVEDYFLNITRNAVEERESRRILGGDFMDFLVDFKNCWVEPSLKLEEVAAQAFAFVTTGYETTSSTLAFCLYELALHQEIQQNIRLEIQKMLSRYSGEFTYKGLKELPLLKQVLCEAMRLHTLVESVVRVPVKNYQVMDTKFTLEKGISVLIPIDAIHHDPEIYPNPEEFEPSRFTSKMIATRHPLAWLPLGGQGPRNCIGWRFAEMQILLTITILLHNFTFSPSDQLQIPLDVDPEATILKPKHGIQLSVQKVSK